MNVKIVKVVDKENTLGVKVLIDGRKCSFGVVKADLSEDPDIARLQIVRKAIDYFPVRVENPELTGEIEIPEEEGNGKDEKES